MCIHFYNIYIVFALVCGACEPWQINKISVNENIINGMTLGDHFGNVITYKQQLAKCIVQLQRRDRIRLCVISGDTDPRETSVCINVIDWHKDWWSTMLQHSAVRCLYLFDLTVLKQQCRELRSHHPAWPLRLNKQTICLEQIYRLPFAETSNTNFPQVTNT